MSFVVAFFGVVIVVTRKRCFRKFEKYFKRFEESSQQLQKLRQRFWKGSFNEGIGKVALTKSLKGASTKSFEREFRRCDELKEGESFLNACWNIICIFVPVLTIFWDTYLSYQFLLWSLFWQFLDPRKLEFNNNKHINY